MRQFLTGNEVAFRDLERRAQCACVRFGNQEMPPGCRPDRADVGIETNERPHMVRLLVTRGVTYLGSELEVRNWLTAGVKQFESFGELRRWIEGPLSRAFNVHAATIGVLDAPLANRPTAAELTDLPDVVVFAN